MTITSVETDDSVLQMPKGKVAVMWKHFGCQADATTRKLTNTGKATCRLCKNDVSHSGGMTNLCNHLQASHPVEYSELIGMGNSET